MATTKNTGRSLQDILDSQSTNTSSKNYSHNQKYAPKKDRRRNRDSFNKNNRENQKSLDTKYSDSPYNNSKLSSVSISDTNEFPELFTKKTDSDSTNTLDFKGVVNKIQPVTPNLNIDKPIPGWTVINTKTKTIVTYDKFGKKVDRSNSVTNSHIETSVPDIYKAFEIMSKRWCSYYDSMNDLLGDRSPYINYKTEIEKLVEEDNELYRKMYEDVDDFVSSDDDFDNFDD